MRFLYILLRSDVGWDVVKKPKTAGIAADDHGLFLLDECKMPHGE